MKNNSQNDIDAPEEIKSKEEKMLYIIFKTFFTSVHKRRGGKEWGKAKMRKTPPRYVVILIVDEKKITRSKSRKKKKFIFMKEVFTRKLCTQLIRSSKE